MNKPLMLIPPAQAEALYDDALRNDAVRAQSQTTSDKDGWDDSSVWDDEDVASDRHFSAVQYMSSNPH